MASPRPSVAIFAPDLLLSATIEARGTGEELHFHPAGQGAWVARMAAELGAIPVLCSFVGGETGTLIRALLEALPLELRLTATAGTSGGYVVDRRDGERRVLASSLRPPRHEIDDLVSRTVAAALGSRLLVVCNPYPAEGLPVEVYDTVLANVRAAGMPVLVDLSSPRPDQVLRHKPDLVKLNDWELAEYVQGPVDGERLLVGARTLVRRRRGGGDPGRGADSCPSRRGRAVRDCSSCVPGWASGGLRGHDDGRHRRGLGARALLARVADPRCGSWIDQLPPSRARHRQPGGS